MASAARLSHAFHVSPTINRASILAVGLDYHLGISPWDDEYPEGTYLWRKLSEAVAYAEGFGDPCDIWELLVDVEIWGDPLHSEAAYTEAKLPPEAFRPVLHIPGVNELHASIVVPPFPVAPLLSPLESEPASLAVSEALGLEL